jgi:beta-lactam-binding protein with PASTA domain
MTQIHTNAQVRPLPPTDPRYLTGGANTQVPNVIGMSEQDAASRLQQAGYKVATDEINSSQAKGTVVSQSPRSSALQGATITLRVSTGYVPPPQTSDPPPTSGSPPPSGGGGGGGGGGRPSGGNNPGGPEG